jgi:anti-sigma B factor antagonist
MARDMPALVKLPAEIDFTNAEEVSGQICAAVQPGVTVVIADLTGTIFCDTSGIRHLLLAHRRAAENQVQLRFAVPSDCPVRRILQLTGLHGVLALYPTLDEAMTGGPPPALAETGEHAAGQPPAQ